MSVARDWMRPVWGSSSGGGTSRRALAPTGGTSSRLRLPGRPALADAPASEPAVVARSSVAGGGAPSSDAAIQARRSRPRHLRAPVAIASSTLCQRCSEAVSPLDGGRVSPAQSGAAQMSAVHSSVLPSPGSDARRPPTTPPSTISASAAAEANGQAPAESASAMPLRHPQRRRSTRPAIGWKKQRNPRHGGDGGCVCWRRIMHSSSDS